MHAPSTADLLLAWECGLDQSPTGRALALLRPCLPGISADKLAALPIGARDIHLLGLRESLFGNAVAAISQCSRCGEMLDITFTIREILCLATKKNEAEAIETDGQTHQLHAEGYDVCYRVPTSADLLAIAETAGDIEPQNVLLQRCVIELQQNGTAVPIGKLPDAVVAAISQEMAEADPHARIELGLICPECSHAWHSLFDIATFLWAEIHAWARRILQDIHTLAWAYGWRETDILAMSARRREIYLELAQS